MVFPYVHLLNKFLCKSFITYLHFTTNYSLNMKKYALLCLASCLVSSQLFLSCSEASKPSADKAPATDEGNVQRGRYLVTTMGCNDCHSPKIFTDHGPEPDSNLLLSGHPSSIPVAKFDTATAKNWVLFHPMNTIAAGPWGITFSANLTPDSTGIGGWTEEQFSLALRHGKSKGLEAGRMLLPPMPWANYVHLNDEDLHAIFIYLKSIKPVHNVVPQPIPPAQ